MKSTEVRSAIGHFIAFTTLFFECGQYEKTLAFCFKNPSANVCDHSLWNLGAAKQ